MPFTHEQEGWIRQAIEGRLGGVPVCPLCRHDQWGITSGIVVDAVYPPGRIAWLTEGARPRIHLTCAPCGNILAFNLTVLGLEDLAKDIGAGDDA